METTSSSTVPTSVPMSVQTPNQAKMQMPLANQATASMTSRPGKKAVETWETDGGKVPSAEKTYLVHGEMKRGFFAWMEWKFIQVWKRIQAFFSKESHLVTGPGKVLHR